MIIKKKLYNFMCVLLACIMTFSTSAPALAKSTVEIELNNQASKVIVSDEGITIYGTYYTKAEFIQLMSTAVKVNTDGNVVVGPQISSESISVASSGAISGLLALFAGTWAIPGIGELVLITVGGAIIIAGVNIASGWIYDAVVEFFQKKDYNDAKEDGGKANNHSTQTGGSLDTTGDPYSSEDLKDSSGVKQRRYYDKNGDADMDIDYRHGGNGKEPFPHRHDWNNGVRGPAYW